MSALSKYALIGIAMVAQVAIGGSVACADEAPGLRPKARVATANRSMSYVCEYRSGWWQSLRFGRVFPRWSETCREEARNTAFRYER